MPGVGRERQRSGGDTTILTVAAAGFLATVAVAAISLPSRVDVYFTPTDRPDVTYELWQYLTLVTVGAAVAALALGTMATGLTALVSAFTRGVPDPAPGIAARVGAWTLVWLGAEVWLVMWFGNGRPETRSWSELLTALAGLAGAGAIVGWSARRGARRAPKS
jgi:hypothetical protein